VTLETAEFERRAELVGAAAAAAKLDALIGYSAGNSPGPVAYLAGYEPSFGLSDIAFVVLVPGPSVRRTLVTNSYWDDVEHVAKVDDVVITRSHAGAIHDLLPVGCERVGLVGFDFFPTGVLTALAGYRPTIRWEDSTGLVQAVAALKSPAEVALMRRAAAASDAGGRRFSTEVAAGRSERAIQEAVDHAIIEAGADRPAFRTFLMTGPRIAVGIGFAGPRRLEDGEQVNVLCGAQVSGYRVELGRVMAVGTPSDEAVQLMEAAADMHDAMRAVIHPGAPVARIAEAAMTAAAKGGYAPSVWAPHDSARDFGHGMGCWVSEPPQLREGGGGVLQAGMALSVEARLAVPRHGGAVISEIVLVEANGSERLSSLPLRLWRDPNAARG
jgi:Xaa-Pro dipeptidase